MTTITIRDLPDNVDLDRKAMREISGGSRYRSQAGVRSASPSDDTRLVDFRTGAKPSAGTAKQADKKQK